MGYLCQDTRTVTGIFFGTACSAVVHSTKNVKGILNYPVGFTAVKVSNETYAARVVFKLRIV